MAEATPPNFMSATSLPLRNVPRVRERELLRVAAALAGDDPKAAAQAARREVLTWAAKQVGDQLPSAATEGRSFEHLRGGRNCIGANFEDEHRSLWAIRADRPDADVAQRIWTTEIVTGYGYPASAIRLIVFAEVSLVALYLVPWTSVLATIVMTGYLGGAVATHARIGSPLFTHTLFGVYVGIIMWAGIYLRDPALRALFPVRPSKSGN